MNGMTFSGARNISTPQLASSASSLCTTATFRRVGSCPSMGQILTCCLTLSRDYCLHVVSSHRREDAYSNRAVAACDL